jgi:D-alanyl-D-alanine carboxypeptidase/D-alanyl-D-alanine carboxypeptidase (penicillin-binding protein 5/6)
MNEKAKAMGLVSTRFENPHGLYHEEHYTTAYELARIAAEALRNPLLRHIVSTYKASIPSNGVPNARLLINHNKLLRAYSGAIGVKTGFTKKTGRTLVSAAERNGMTLIAVTLDAPNDWSDHTALLDYGYTAYERLTVAEEGTLSLSVPVTGGICDSVTLTNTEPLSLLVPKGSAPPPLLVERSCRFLFAPVLAGEDCGYVSVRSGKQQDRSPLQITESIALQKETKHFLFTLPFSKKAS